MKNQTIQNAQKALATFAMVLLSVFAFAQWPGGGGHGGPGNGGNGGGGNHGGNHGGHPGHHPGGHHGGGGIGGNHHNDTCNAHFINRRDTVVNGLKFRTFGNTGAATYAWDFGDGSTSTDPNPAHTFPDTGWYNVCLTVTDTIGGGCTGTWCDSVHVFTPAPRCNAHFGVRGDSLANTLNFHRGPSSSTATYAWDFGDGTTSTDPNPQHTYATAGIYYVCLTVTNTNAGGTCTDTWCDSVDTAMPPCPGGHHGGGHHRVASSTTSATDVVVNVYPNPMVESTTVYLENTSGNATLRVYGVNGQVVMTKQVTNGDNKISRENLTEGLYFYSIEDAGAVIANGKLRVY